jgi:Cof subfamily protein (haloacid dehalogenase superfamily)
MDIKVVVVDMDGTFLRQKPILDAEGELIGMDQDYDREVFEEVFSKLKAKGGRFVVASGNQYYQLKSFFPNLDDQITYISENGALVMENQEELFSVKMKDEVVKEIVDVLEEYPEILTEVCGKKAAYVKTGNKRFRDFMKLFYYSLEEVEAFSEIKEDEILKFALMVPETKIKKYYQMLRESVGHIIDVVDSGHGCIDLIVPGFNKATAVEFLCKRWGFTNDQVMAFGDGGNDIEMIAYAKYGIAMANAREEVKAVAYDVCESNNEQGVLKTLQRVL